MTHPECLAGVLAEVQDVADWLWQRGWAERNAGNLSIDVTDLLAGDAAAARLPSAVRGATVPYAIPDPLLAGRALLVSATGARFRDTAREPGRGLALLRIADDLAGYEVNWAGDPGATPPTAPTSELASHLLVHARLRALGSDHRAVLHTHPTHLIALGHMPLGADETWLNRALWAMMPEVRVFVADGVGIAPYRLPGSLALADATVAALTRHRVVLWEKHGCVAVERDLTEAFDLLDTLDKAARIYLTCLAAGGEPRGLSDDELGELDDLARRLGGR